MPNNRSPSASDRVLLNGATVSISEHRKVHVDPGLTDERGDMQPSLTIARQGAHLHHAHRETSVVDAGSAVLYRGDAPFRLSHPFLRASPDVSLYLEFAPALLDEIFGPTPQARDLGHPLPPALQAAAALLATHAGEDDALTDEERGLRLLDGVAREHAFDRADPAPAAAARHKIVLVREAIAAAPDMRHDLAALAAVAGCSPFHLTRLFRRVTGVTLGQFHLHLRLARALQLLADGADNLSSVAQAAGFFDHAHLTTSLRRVFGTTPTALREQLGGHRLTVASKVLQAETLRLG